ncbi:MAG: ornithine carbamoyltransferase [Nanoarchaeota archaeon]|nr:ornithine carbamoyltransferase [Nanoarchaeota archaeon]
MNLLTLKDWSSKDIISVLNLAQDMKKTPSRYANHLINKTLAMLFQKTSTRTRMSFEAAMTQLGGHAQYIDWRTTNIKEGNLKEEIKCIERYVDIIMARVYEHKDIQIMAEASKIPIINGLCNLYHPCQILADLLTVKEKFGKLEGIKLAYIGDGNNVCHSLLIGCAKTGVEISVATPKGYEPLEEIVKSAKKISNKISIFNDPKKAVKDANVVYTDTWISMGQEEEKKKRLKAFKGWTVNSKLMNLTKNAYFMHCLPAYKGYEVSEDVLNSKKSIVFDQAENRLHAQKAVLLKCLQIC